MILPTIVAIQPDGIAVVRRRHQTDWTTWYMHWPVRPSVYGRSTDTSA